jgi:hypothetical protein
VNSKMFIDVKPEHIEEWQQLFIQKVSMYSECAEEVAGKLFENKNLKDYSPQALDFIRLVTNELIQDTNTSFSKKRPQSKGV